MAKIAILSLSRVFGGHESVTVSHLEAAIGVLKNHDIKFFFNKENTRLLDAIKGGELIRYIHLEPIDCVNKKSPRSLIILFFLIRKRLKAACADSVLLVQGNPDSGLLGLFAAKSLGLPVTSYLPLPHRLSYTGGKFPSIRDWFVEKMVFPRFNRHITISNSLKSTLEQRGVPSKNIEVVENSIEILNRHQPAPIYSRGFLKILSPGRVHFSQKGQDILVRELRILADDHPKSFQCDIAGDGPDLNLLKNMIEESGITDNFAMLGWKNNIDELMSDYDLVLLTSRYEGVPLVMLEGIAAGCIVIGPDRDGMKDYLPPEWRFDINQEGALARLLSDIDLASEQRKIPSIQEKLSSRLDSRLLGERFVEMAVS